jgi:predicted DNA-binding WGR domain protein
MRYFEYTKGNSNKFWEVNDYWNEDRMNVQVRYGKIGTEGRTIRHYYAKFRAGSKLVDKLVAQKLKKGYVERKFKVKRVFSVKKNKTGSKNKRSKGR